MRGGRGERLPWGAGRLPLDGETRLLGAWPRAYLSRLAAGGPPPPGKGKLCSEELLLLLQGGSCGCVRAAPLAAAGRRLAEHCPALAADLPGLERLATAAGQVSLPLLEGLVTAAGARGLDVAPARLLARSLAVLEAGGGYPRAEASRRDAAGVGAIAEGLIPYAILLEHYQGRVAQLLEKMAQACFERSDD